MRPVDGPVVWKRGWLKRHDVFDAVPNHEPIPFACNETEHGINRRADESLPDRSTDHHDLSCSWSPIPGRFKGDA